MDNHYDVVIVGAGIAGLYCALNLNPKLKVLLLSKKEYLLSNTNLAQGGIAAVLDEENDSVQKHMNDTLIAGKFKNNMETLKILVGNGAKEIKKIIEYGVEFDKNQENQLALTLEGGHSCNRIVHHKDYTGHEIMQKLTFVVKNRPNITFLENSALYNAEKIKNGFSVNILNNKQHINLSCYNLVLATGGIGRVYKYTTNSSVATGEGIYIADKLGAKIKDLHLVQFHPTAFNSGEYDREMFLISEAVRGEGGYLLNYNNQRFMQNYDDRLELAPRDVVSKAIIEEQQKTGSDKFYLDISHKNSDFIKNRFPMIYKKLLERGYDITKQKIPIYPCQHYLMGGILVDINSETSVDGLYAVGECANTGVHGLNRLASNSLLEGLVFSNQCAENINENINVDLNLEIKEQNFKKVQQTIPVGIRTMVRDVMQKTYFVIQNNQEILNGFEQILELKNMFKDNQYKINIDYIEAQSLVTVAYFILKEML